MEYDFSETNENNRKRWTWSLVGEHGGVHIWAQFCEASESAFGEKCYGGVEVHYRKPPYEHSEGTPHHEYCWLLEGPCWHDGSSLYFSEQLQPIIEMTDRPERLTNYMNAELLSWYRSHLSKEFEPVSTP